MALIGKTVKRPKKYILGEKQKEKENLPDHHNLLKECCPEYEKLSKPNNKKMNTLIKMGKYLKSPEVG